MRRTTIRITPGQEREADCETCPEDCPPDCEDQGDDYPQYSGLLEDD